MEMNNDARERFECLKAMNTLAKMMSDATRRSTMATGLRSYPIVLLMKSSWRSLQMISTRSTKL